MNTTFDFTKPIAIGCDHAGFEYKTAIAEWLKEKKYLIKDFGSFSEDAVDYPDFAHPVATSVEKNESAFGILICGSANGVAIAANKHQHIRAGISWENDIAKLMRQHNDANIICIPSRFVAQQLALEMIENFMNISFEAGGRHERRLQKIECV